MLSDAESDSKVSLADSTSAALPGHRKELCVDNVRDSDYMLKLKVSLPFLLYCFVLEVISTNTFVCVYVARSSMTWKDTQNEDQILQPLYLRFRS